MKKVMATFCLIGSTIALSACGTTGAGNVDTAPPYSMERTASGTKATPAAAPAPIAPAEQVFQRAQTK